MSKFTLLANLFSLAFCAACVNAQDTHSAAISAAKSQYFAAEGEYDQRIRDWFDSQETRARARGDRDAVVSIKSMRTEYSSSNAVPTDLPRLISRQFDSAKTRLRRDYESIVSDLTRDGLDKRAADAEAELKALLSGVKPFVQLLNGRNLDGWEKLPNDSSVWKVQNGMLLGSGSKGYLFTNRADYGDFTLRAEVRLSANENGGLFLRCPMTPGKQKGYEINLNSPTRANETKQTGTIRCYPLKRDGFAAHVVTIPPHGAGEWFKVETSVSGNSIVVTVNGKKTSEHIDNENSFMSGRIAIQHHSGEWIAIRSLEIREDQKTK
ncbi:3-keto-disaccharide hydrolase [Rosistilla oblonga]|uniref:3-keto-disaccharide hydrolase n=1 Tax=Rosistilla oblonga TaxID=2527990 RepID=UPI003A969B40